MLVTRATLSVCHLVYSQRNSTMKDPKVFKLAMTLKYLRSGMVSGLKNQRSRSGLALGLTAIRHGFELYECLLVFLHFIGILLIFILILLLFLLYIIIIIIFCCC